MRKFLLALGVVLVTAGAAIALRPLFGDGRPFTQSRWLDMAFAVVFLVRGVMNIRASRRSTRPPFPPGRPGVPR